jgi:hypothetical protein
MKDLTGKGKPFHSALDKAAALLKRKVGTGAEFMQELKGLGGIKQAEIDERKLGEVMGMPRMTHDQFVAELGNRPAPAIGETVFGEKPSQEDIVREANRDIRHYAGEYASDNAETSKEYRELMAQEARRLRGKHRGEITRSATEYLTKPTHHEDYTLPGGENYREMLIKAPKGGEEFGGVRSHFGGEPDILASLRLKDRTGPNGEKLLHLEELQSDWHQQGRDKGYHDPEKLAQAAETVKALKEEHKRLGIVKSQTESEEERNAIAEQRLAIMGQIRDATIMPSDHVPDAPFKKNWEEMALKRLIHHAAENGYQGIVVTPGNVQADRYSLAKQIDALEWDQRTGRLYAKQKDGNDFNKMADGVTTENLSDYVGKEVAEKLMSQPSTGTNRQLNGVDLEVGGEGMKGFYDKKVPNILNTIGKKYGVKTELNGHKLKISDDLNFPEETSRRNNLPAKVAGETRDVHHFPITEDMRKDILTNGLPLYKEGGIIRKAEGGNVQLTVEQMRQQLMNAGKPLNDMSQIGAQEAPNMPVKNFVIPQNGAQGSLPMGGVDMSPMQPGQQMMPANALQPNPLMPQQPDQQQGGAPMGGAPLGGMPPPPPAGGSNILQMTPQGQAMAAMRPPQPMQKAEGGMVGLPMTFKVGGSDNMPMNNDYSDNGATDYDMDNIQQLAKGGQAKKQTVAEMKEAIFQKAQQGLMKPSEALGRHEGKYMHITEADRAKVEKRKHGMRGGVGFSQIGLEDPEYAGMSWGVGKPGTGIKLLNRQRRGLTPDEQSIYTTFIGTPEMHTSNQLVFNRMYNKFMEARKSGLLSPEQEAKMLDILRSLMTKGTKKNPSKPIFDKDINFDSSHQAFNTFDRRRALSNLMAGVGIGGKKGQIFDASKMIEDTTDPRLLHAPTLSVGPHVFSLSGEMSNRPDLNKAFPIMLHGESYPEAFQQLPFKEAAPDFTEQIKKSKGRDPGYMDIVRGIPRQQLTEKYLTGLQKIGKKKGGKVTDNLDTMRLSLTRNKKAK